jgi:hypothetical protein
MRTRHQPYPLVDAIAPTRCCNTLGYSRLMRETHRCPKCKHEKVLHVPEPKDTDYDRMAIGGMRSVWSGATVLTAEPRGPYR